MTTKSRDHCEACGIPIPHVDEDADPAARLCDTCYGKTETNNGVSPRLQSSINAIKARINGEWDHPDLEAVGPLSTDFSNDVETILKHYKIWG